MLGWGEGTNVTIYWLNLVTKRTIRLKWKFKVENHGSSFDLKLFLYGFGSFISVFKFDFNFSV